MKRLQVNPRGPVHPVPERGAAAAPSQRAESRHRPRPWQPSDKAADPPACPAADPHPHPRDTPPARAYLDALLLGGEG